MVDGGSTVAGQLYDLLCVQNVRVAFKLGQIIRLQQLRRGGFSGAGTCGEGIALRVLFQLPEEDAHIFLFDFIPQPPVGAVDIGDEPLVQQIPGAALADMRGLAELPLTEYVRVRQHGLNLLRSAYARVRSNNQLSVKEVFPVLEVLKKTANKTYTENGAVPYRTSGKDCLDLFASIGSLRHADDRDICNRFLKAYAENRDLAMKILFYARDVRGGRADPCDLFRRTK